MGKRKRTGVKVYVDVVTDYGDVCPRCNHPLVQMLTAAGGQYVVKPGDWNGWCWWDDLLHNDKKGNRCPVQRQAHIR